MKKIVGIIAALAMATAVFAADVSAKVVLNGNLFKYNADKSMSAMDIDKPGAQHWNGLFSLSANNDNAGASFSVWTGEQFSMWHPGIQNGLIGWWNDGKVMLASRWQIWMRPVDGLKLIYGLNGFKLNEEHIRWSKSDSGAEDYGYSINYSNDGLSIDFALLPGLGTSWMSKADGGDALIGKTAFKFGYSADFGNIGALFVADKSADKDGKVKSFNNLKFGAGYSNNFGGVQFFTNILGYMNNDFQKLRAEFYAAGNADAFGWSVFPVVEYYAAEGANPWKDDKGKNDGPVEVFLLAKGTYALDGCQAYFEFADLQGLLHFGKDANDWDGGNRANFKFGATGNVDGASWDAGVQLIIGEKVNFSIPVEFSFGW